jgi:aspartate aminotransferase-like enzyme
MCSTPSATPDTEWKSFDGKLSCVPGAVDLNAAVLRSMNRHYVNPWAADFQRYYNETLQLLKILYGTSQDVVTMIGPTRAAMDAAVCSLVEPGDRVAVATNGHWSQLFVELIRAHGGEAVVLAERWGLPLDPDKIRSQLRSVGPGIKALAITHVGTSTGVVNPAEEIGQIVRDFGLLYIVDVAQSLGGEEVCMDDWGVDFCLASNAKCLSAPAGLAHIGISRDAWLAIEQRTTSIRGWYTSLPVWRRVWMERESGYFTFPSSVLFGLRASLDQIFAIGLQELYRRYAVVSKAIRQGVKEMGLKLIADDDQADRIGISSRSFCANTVTAVYLPEGLSYEAFAQVMDERYDIGVAGTYGEFAGRAFRVSPTGLAQLKPGNVIRLVASLGLTLRQLGITAPVERALWATDAILADL